MAHQEIGKGTFGSVFTKTQHHTVTAVKKIPLNPSSSHSLILNEDSILSLCSHPHIVAYHSGHYSQAEQHFYIEMEHLPGGNLSQVDLFANFHLIERWLTQITSALVYLHERGIIHRDVKLHNLMLDGEGNAKLIDFGISTWKWMLEYQGYTQIGSPCYMAPEMVLQKKYDEKIDVFALGICVYQLIHKRSPFKGSNKQEYWEHMITDKVEYGRQCSEKMKFLLKKMLKKDQHQRISSFELLNLLMGKTVERVAKVVKVRVL